jgi:hypothetical protein
MQMDVDMDAPASLPSSGLKRSSISPPLPSTEKRPKLNLPQQQLTVLNKHMKYMSGRQIWQIRFDSAGDDNSQWRDLFSDVLMSLTLRLATTDLKTSIIPPQDLDGSDNIVKGFNNDDLREWKDGVQKGVKEDDWTDLIAHRMYHSAPESFDASQSNWNLTTIDRYDSETST